MCKSHPVADLRVIRADKQGEKASVACGLAFLCAPWLFFISVILQINLSILHKPVFVCHLF